MRWGADGQNGENNMSATQTIRRPSGIEAARGKFIFWPTGSKVHEGR